MCVLTLYGQDIQKQIEAEIPLIGQRVPLSTLFKYFEGDDLFTQKLQHLAEDYSDIVQIRPDGNCFYRAFAFALFEHILGKRDEINRLKDNMKKTRDFLVEKLNYPDVTVEDFYEQVAEFVSDLQTVNSAAELTESLSDPGIASYVICWMRLVASAELQRQPDFYINFLPEVGSVQDFCRREVEPLGVDIDHVVITALSTGLEVPVRVACLERRIGEPQIINFFNDDAKINLLFRPGHYDILYSQL